MTLRELFYQHHIHRPAELAERVGIARSYASLIFTGRRKISRYMAEKISAATGIPVADLITAEPPIPLPKKSR